MTDKEFEKIRKPVIQIDPTLDDKYKGMTLFPESVARCKETIKKIGLPEWPLKEKK